MGASCKPMGDEYRFAPGCCDTKDFTDTHYVSKALFEPCSNYAAFEAVMPSVDSKTDPMCGPPLRTGDVLYIRPGKSAEEMLMSLFFGGFKLRRKIAEGESQEPEKDITDVECRWSPFSLVEKRNLRSGRLRTILRGFALKVIGTGDEQTHYFMFAGENAIEDRNVWLQAVLSSIRVITLALFHTSAYTRLSQNDTPKRLMWGYLLVTHSPGGVILHFCELLLFSKYETQFVAWQGANWDEKKTSVQITEVTRIVQYKGLHCNIFRINLLLLCALTLEDKRNWLQALGSTQSELMAAQPRQRDFTLAEYGSTSGLDESIYVQADMQTGIGFLV